MNYPPQPSYGQLPPNAGGSAPGNERPTTVTAAVGCMILAVLLMLVSVAVSIVLISTLSDKFDAMAGGSGAPNFGTIFKYIQIGTIVLYLLVSVTIMALAVGNLRGRNGTRIATWVISGLFALCGLCGSLSTFGSGMGTSSVDTYALMPTWYKPVSVSLAVLMMLAHAGVIILLALPKSNAFFRQAKAAQQQVPNPGYPGYPAGGQSGW